MSNLSSITYLNWQKLYIDKILSYIYGDNNKNIIEQLQKIIEIRKFKFNPKHNTFELIAKTKDIYFKFHFQIIINKIQFNIIDSFEYYDNEIQYSSSLLFGYNIWKIDTNYSYIDTLNSITWIESNLLLDIDSFEYFMDHVEEIYLNNKITNLNYFQFNNIESNIVLNINCDIKSIHIMDLINFKQMCSMCNYFTTSINNNHTDIYNILIKLKNNAIIHINIVDDNFMTNSIYNINVIIIEYENIIDFVKSKNKCIYDKLLFDKNK